MDASFVISAKPQFYTKTDTLQAKYTMKTNRIQMILFPVMLKKRPVVQSHPRIIPSYCPVVQLPLPFQNTDVILASLLQDK